jgi:hypothetical protein
MHVNSHDFMIARRRRGSAWPLHCIIGAVMLANYALVVAVKIATNIPEEMLWASHVGLLVGGLGLLLNRDILVTSATTLIFTFHGAWIIDAVGWLTTGTFPIGVTSYLADADWPTWLATFHHFYLLPVLIILVLLRRRWARRSWFVAVLVFSILTLLSRLVGSSEYNVNSAFRVVDGMDDTFFARLNSLPGAAYLLAIDAIAAANFFVVSSVFGLICRTRDSNPGQLADLSAGG